MSVEEKHYSPKELAKAWGVSATFVRDLFRNEPGVVVIAKPKRGHVRAYATIRIPASVAERVYRRNSRVGKVGGLGLVDGS